MSTKIYGAKDMMDWTAMIKVGKGSMSVHFTGGALDQYGLKPAKFTTSKKLIQTIIERSDYFKNGKIVLLEEREFDGIDNSVKTAVVAPAKPVAKPAVKNSESMTENEPASETGANGGITENSGAGEVERVSVSDKNEAVEWLKEHFAEKNYTATSLRTKAQFDAACKECGVEFVGI